MNTMNTKEQPMRISRTMGLALGAGLALAGLAGGQAEAGPATQAGCQGNLLQNADFEGGSRKTESEGTSLSSAVSNGWSPWFVRGDARNNREPEFKVEQTKIGGDRNRIRSGTQSMKFFTTWGTHTAGMYQRVPVRAGTPLTFAAHGMSYSGEADGWNAEKGTFESDRVTPGNYKMWVGIEPNGALPACMGCPPPDSVIWSEANMTNDQWVRLGVSAKATGPAVTVYTKGSPEWAVKHNDSFWEDACLSVGGTPANPPAAVAVAASGAAPVAARGAAPVAVAAAARSAAAPITGTSYVIKPGDSLSAISARTGVSVAALAAANNIANPSLIRAGATITIPKP
jgi:LysM repeat protein